MQFACVTPDPSGVCAEGSDHASLHHTPRHAGLRVRFAPARGQGTGRTALPTLESLEIHSSPQGRALETARPTAELLGLPVIIEPWARELNEESKTLFPDGVPKTISHLTAAYLHDPAFRNCDSGRALAEIPGLSETGFPARYREISEGLDAMLSSLGYVRNGKGLYDVKDGNGRHVALFCHCGMSRVLISHLLHVPYQLLGATLMNHFTGITVFHFDGDAAEICPELISYGDVGHLYRDGKPLIHYMKKVPF